MRTSPRLTVNVYVLKAFHLSASKLAFITVLLAVCSFAGAASNLLGCWNQIGAHEGADYEGNFLSVSATASGAHLHCMFQSLDGEASCEGLRLISTLPSQPHKGFRVKATALGRSPKDRSTRLQPASDGCRSEASYIKSFLPKLGQVCVDGDIVQFIRPGLVEEYTVSIDGVRQDFIVAERPSGEGLLTLELELEGTKAEPFIEGCN